MEKQLIIAYDATRAYSVLLARLLEEGERYSPRGMRTRELRPVVVRIDGPRRWVGQPTRKLSIPLGVLEALQIVGGFSAPAALIRVAPQYARFVNPSTGQLDGAYGPRLASQMGYLQRVLRQDPDTRQAVATIYGPQDQRTSLDVPCTVGLQFFLRSTIANGDSCPSGHPEGPGKGRRLELIVNMRSNDAWLGWPYDVIQFSVLQEALAADLGVEVGGYTHVSGSMHLYERNVEAARQVAGDSCNEGPDPPKLLRKDFAGTAREARVTVQEWWKYHLPTVADLSCDADEIKLRDPFFEWCLDRLVEGA